MKKLIVLVEDSVYDAIDEHVKGMRKPQREDEHGTVIVERMFANPSEWLAALANTNIEQAIGIEKAHPQLADHYAQINALMKHINVTKTTLIKGVVEAGDSKE